MTATRQLSALLCLLCVLCAAPVLAQPELLELEIGDPARRARKVQVELDAIIDTERDETVSAQALAARATGSRLVLVGEEHTGHEFHAVQLRVLKLLHAAGVALTVGLEMIPADKQLALDAWIAGELDEQSFLETSDWYRIWGYNWAYYRDIFMFARQNAIPMFALRAVDDDSDASMLTVEPPTDEQRALIAAFFEADSPVHGGLSPAQLDALVVAQAQRDAAMARHAMDALETHPERTMVLLAGTGHVLYELGIVAQLPAAERADATTIVPVPVEDEPKTVRASVADFVWGIPDADYPRYPELGVITMQAENGLRVIHVEPASPAGSAGLTVGDVLTHFADTALGEKRDLSASLAAVSWGDEVRIGLRRDDESEELAVAFRR